MRLGHRFHHAVEVEAAGLLARREFAEALQPLPDVGARRREHEHVLGEPLVVAMPSYSARSKGSHAQIAEQGGAQLFEGLYPDVQSVGVLPQEGDLPLVVAQGCNAAVVGPVDELLARPFALTLERRKQVVAVEVDLVGHVADLLALQQVFLDRGVAGSGEQGREHVLVRTDVVDDRAGLDDAGPADQRRHAVAAFPVGVLLTAEHRRAAIGPAHAFRAVVGGIHDDGVLFEAQLLELGEHLADMAVVLDHAVGIDTRDRSCRRTPSSGA